MGRKCDYLFLLVLTFLFSCDQKKAQNSIPVEATCATHVMVKDYSGMDGCQFLLVTNEGDKFLPVSWPKMDFELKNNQSIKIGYTEVQDAVSICMMESKSVIVICVEFIAQTGGVKPAKKECAKVDKPFDADWLATIAKKYNPYQIDRYDYLGSRYAYYIDIGKKKMLYDCSGYLICEVEGKALNDCTNKVKELRGKKTIWQKEVKD